MASSMQSISPYGIIYCTTNLVNGKKYIGQDSKNDPTYLGSGQLLQLAIHKYGQENFIKEPIQDCVDKQDLEDSEKYWIDYFNAVQSDLFYNISSGGTGGYLGPEVSRLMSERRKVNLRSSCFKKGVGSKPYADRISAAKKGVPVPSRRKRCGKYDLQGNLIKQYDMLIAVSADGYRLSRVLACCKNRANTHAGFIWKYI